MNMKLALVCCSLAMSSFALEVQLVPAWSGAELKRPVTLVSPPDGSGRILVVQQRGQIVELNPDGSGAATTVLDISDRKMEENKFEEGLLNLTFHPQFKSNRKFYLFYSLQDPKVSVISEWTMSADSSGRPDMTSERVLLEVPQPFWNHNSGNMLFGPDGFLYICLGDGGKRDGKHNLSQNPFVLNGKILRIDVDTKTGRRPYGIPADNPFVEDGGVRPEIFALGLRNPWGICFDDQGALWCADVGQEQHEEINIIQAGGNYGWNFREGPDAFEHRKAEPAEELRFVDPIHVYGRPDGISITGGVFYRGNQIPELQGKYLFGDWGTGTIWALTKEGESVKTERIFSRSEGGPKIQPSAFCTLPDGEVALLNWGGGIFTIQAP